MPLHDPRAMNVKTSGAYMTSSPSWSIRPGRSSWRSSVCTAPPLLVCLEVRGEAERPDRAPVIEVIDKIISLRRQPCPEAPDLAVEVNRVPDGNLVAWELPGC